MGYKIHYNYQNFPNCPEATEISRSRESFSAQVLPIVAIGCIATVIGFIFAIVNGKPDWWQYGIAVVVTGLLTYYLVGPYTRRTEKLIKRALSRESDN